MTAFKRSIKICFLTIYLLVSREGKAQDGATLFDDLCADCHSIGDGVYYGPDLMGVEQKRSSTWLLSFIKSSKTMIANGDAEAVAIFNKFDKKKMPDTDASEDEMKAILSYIKSLNKNAKSSNTTEEKDKAVAKTDNESKSDAVETETDNSDDTQVANVEGNADERISSLEKKINELLEMQLRSEEKEIRPENIKNGKRLFTGQKPFVNGAPNCVSCHNIQKTDTFNWNPSAFELATTYSKKNGYDIAKLLRTPSSKKCKEFFKGHELTEYEIFDIKAFLLQVEKDGLLPQKTKSYVLWYVLLALLCLFAILDALFTKYFSRKITIPIFLLGSGFISQAMVKEATSVGITTNYQPEQPIKFSHKVHAGENNIQCLYCHSTAEYSKVANIPSASVCMNCHNKIKTGTNSGSFEIKKIYKELKTGQSIKWVKVHNLPDHVFYSHAQHVGAGKLDCKNCHGDVKNMVQIKQVSPLSMGWCLDCHRKHKVNFSNKYYNNYKKLHEEINSGKRSVVTVKDIGGEDCQKCHY